MFPPRREGRGHGEPHRAVATGAVRVRWCRADRHPRVRHPRGDDRPVPVTALRRWTRWVSAGRTAVLASCPDRERGQISILILGFTVVALMLVVGGVDVTAVQLARARLLDAADGAPLEAADSLDEPGAYGGGFNDAVRLTDATVRQAASGYLGAQPKPTGVSSWALVTGTG